MARHYEGYAKGGENRHGGRPAGDPAGVIGPVGEQFHVAAPSTVALETALGGAMQNLLVEDEAAGKAVLRLVKQRDGGRVTCLPLTALRPVQLREEGLEQEPGYLAVAADLVDCDPRLRPGAQALLGRTVVVDHLDHGVAPGPGPAVPLPVVTLEGEILRPGLHDRRLRPADGGRSPAGAEEADLAGRLAKAQQALAQGEAAPGPPDSRCARPARPWRPSRPPAHPRTPL